MSRVYDNYNVFAKILKGEIPCQKIDENKFSLAFIDINPQAPIHILVIPKNQQSKVGKKAHTWRRPEKKK